MMKNKTGLLFLSLSCLLLGSCIENDLPYPVIQGVIQELETDGFQSATFNKETMEVAVLVDDTVDLRNLRITRMEVNSGALILPDSNACLDYRSFPDSTFRSLNELPLSANTRVDFTQDAFFTLRIYQDYRWRVSVTHNIKRQFQILDASGKAIQVGQPIVDEANKRIIVYVQKGTDLSNLIVGKMQIGSSIATTVPEPQTISDFRSPQFFEVTAFDQTERWEIVVTHSSGSGLTLSAWARRAYIVGDGNENTSINIQYRRKGEELWDQVYSDEITYEEGRFTATLRHLQPSTVYEYQATIGGETYNLAEFTTEEAPQLPNAGFEEWSKPDKVWLVYKEGDEMFWDSGNWGSATLNKNVTNYDEAIYHGGRRSAKLQSEYIVIRFAAGNLFAGEYIETDGTNGIIDFGRPFAARPTALKGWFRYKSTPITRDAPEENIADAQKGMPDQATIWVALGDWDAPVRVKTKKSERQLFDVNDEHIIAYQEINVAETVSDWTEFKLKLEYRSFTRTPKYLLIVASASKYGDYFIGGEGSTLWLDDFELVYE
ncbi:PCMD domain-containing protein [Parabacteroides sp. PF5-6]|uniref:PCMD domain-containing protein n=1 Tax=Parabacteroides sp. PF5-6 TaxID=1742403 RepID=UPI0024076F88|nr:PCMD domain-containing protein [Parabacteroides sp. PF5-6]MDF9831112.1 hypothetical protein [Parabacteroides sp. PF5-6]